MARAPKDLTKGDLVDQIAKQAGITKAQALGAINSFTDIVAKQLAKQGQTRIKNFGTFKTLPREERAGRNPQSGDPIVIPAHSVIRFLPATQMSQDARGEAKPAKKKG